MPILMEKKDWSRTFSSFAGIDRVWQEDVSGGADKTFISLPEEGRFRVFLVKVDDKPEGGHKWRDIPVSPLVEEITGIIPDENPGKSYKELFSDVMSEKYLTQHEAVH